MHLSDPALPPYGGAGPVSIEGVECLLADERWRQITHRRGAKGLLVRQAALVKVWLAKSGSEAASGPFWLLVSRETDGSQIKFSLCHQTDGEPDVEVALGRQMQRYRRAGLPRRQAAVGHASQRRTVSTRFDPVRLGTITSP